MRSPTEFSKRRRVSTSTAIISKLIAAMALEARRKAALERLATWSGYANLSDRERDAIEAEIQKELASQRPKRRR